jgi:flagellar hook assembly protein FlgD
MADAPLALDSAPPQKQAEATMQAGSREDDQPAVEIRNTRISLGAAESSLVWVSLPETAGLEIRLYNRAGQAVNLIVDGRYGPGHLSFKIEPKDAQGMPLATGDYYLRVMSRWFSKVELLTVLP